MNELRKNQIRSLYICVHPEMYSSGEYHARRCAEIIGRAVNDDSIAFVMIPQLELPRTLESVRRQLCNSKITAQDAPWRSASALNDIEVIAQNNLGSRFWYGNILFDFEVRNSYFEEKKKQAFAQVQERFNVTPRPLNKYNSRELYLFEQAKCFGEDMGSCVPVLSKALGLHNVALYTSP